jgi:hypothetical protein
MGVLQSSGFIVAISPKSSELLEIPDPPVSDFGTSGFVELGSIEHISALCIGCKLEHLEWQIRISGFSITY